MQTIDQRVALIRELLPGVGSIAELCCGDCEAQWRAYATALVNPRYRSLDIAEAIVTQNRAKGIDCVRGDVLDPEVLRQFLAFDLVFFGPPLSEECDGHRMTSFYDVTPHFDAFAARFLGELKFTGTLVCICPNSTTMGDVQGLYSAIKRQRPDMGLRLLHHSYSTVTGNGEPTESRLKYIDAWFSSSLPDVWEVRHVGQSGDEGAR